MPVIKRFEDIQAWQKSRELNRLIYNRTTSGRLARDYDLKNQIRRASISIMSNIAEGFERDGNKEFIQFLSIAKGSAGEVRSLLYVVLNAEYISQEEFNQFSELATEIGRIIGGFMQYLERCGLKGTKLK